MHGIPKPIAEKLRRFKAAELELHLPPQDRLDAKHLDHWAAALDLRMDAAGRIVGSHRSDPEPAVTMALHQAVVLVFRAAFGGDSKLTVAAEPGATPLLPAPKPVWRVCDPGGGLANAPPERGHGFKSIYRDLSLKLQESIRLWLPPLHFRSIEDFDTLLQAKALIAYSVATPVAGKHVDQLGVDVLSRETVDRACRLVSKKIGEPLRAVCLALGQSPAAAPAAAALSYRNASRITNEVVRQQRYLHQLFHNEFHLISRFIEFTSQVDAWSNTLRAHPASAAEVVRDIHLRFGRVIDRLSGAYQRRSHFPLASLLLTEAVGVCERAELHDDWRTRLSAEPDRLDLEHAA